MTRSNSIHIDFAGISDQRSGSSWIYRCLESHPEICMSTKKEAQLFSRWYSKWRDLYSRYFAHCYEGQIRGEYSPQYIHEPQAAENIHRHFPNIKLIACLRNPVDRLSSIYWYNRIGGTGSSWRWDSFDQAAQDEEFRKRPLYADKVQHFLEYFDHSQILFVLHDDLVEDPIGFMQEIYRFLDVSESHVSPYTHKRVRATGQNQIQNQMYARGYFKAIHFFEKNPVTATLMRKMKKNHRLMHFGRLFTPKRTPKTQHTEKPAISPQTREYLKEYYRSDVDRLERLTGKNLSRWK